MTAAFLCVFLCACQAGGQADGTYEIIDSAPATDGESGGVDAFDTGDAEAEQENEASVLPGDVTVYICGAVKHPGVYSLPAGKRVADAVTAAGGLKKNAADRCINQAKLLTDSEMIVILTEEEFEGEQAGAGTESGDLPGSGSGENDGLVDINTADAGVLMTLPGIGSSKAKAIIDYREKNGGFSQISDIMNISGIKQGTFDQIKALIKV